MLFSYNWLQSFFIKKLPKPERLAEILTLHSFEVNEVKRIDSDWVLDIDVLPNRAPDCFSHLGIVREISAILNQKYKLPEVKLIEDEKLKIKDFFTVQIKNKNTCLRYTARIISDVKVSSSPKWMQERLKACGLRPINNIVDITNYVMLETGQPLHAFDFEKISGRKIIVRFAKKNEKIITLDEEKYDLFSDVLVIADEKKPIAIAGIKGGKEPEIDQKTKIIILESANFNPQIIRQGSKEIDLKTDASWRFEHGIDPNLTEFAINRATYLIQKIAKGKIIKGVIDFYPQKVLSKKIKLNQKYVEKLLGVEIPSTKIKEILKRLNFDFTLIGKEILVKVPTYRLDINLQEDLIEEIGRIYGYEKILPIFPIVSLIPPKKNLEIFWEDSIKDFLKEVGFTEIYNYSFIGEEEAKIFKFTSYDLVELENPVSMEQKYLRPSLIPNLLKNVERNLKLTLNYKNLSIKIFELGKIFQKFQKTKGEEIIIEKKMLSGAILGDDFFHLKGIVDLLLNKAGISSVWYDEYKPSPENSKAIIWHPKKCAEIKINNEEIGFLGEISPKILNDLKIKNKVVVFDIDFEKLSKLASEEHEFRPISKFPAAIRDIAILVPRTVKVEEVLNKIEEVGGNLIRDIDLFDIYEGEELPLEKKSLAFHIIYQAEDRTLNSEEIDEIQKRIINALENVGWEVRQ